LVFGEIRGNVVNPISALDGPDSGDANDINAPTVTQVVYNNIAYNTFITGTDDVGNVFNYIKIITEFGTLLIHETGYYTFSQNGLVIDTDQPVEPLVFEYTIQDGDTVNQETDSAILTLNITPPPGSEPLKAPEPSAKFIELDLDETDGSIDTFSHTQSKTGFDEGPHAFIQDMQLDLSDVLVETHSNNLDKYLEPGDDGQKVAFNPDLGIETGKGAPMEQDLVLEKAGSESEEGTGVYVTNGLLAQGGLIISDAFAANPAPLPEFDTQDVL
jgi:hypothetical protein